MYMSREVFHCKPGKAKDMVALFRKLSSIFESKGWSKIRIYTDMSGENYWTVVAEQEIPKLDDIDARMKIISSDPQFGEAFKGYHDFILDGTRELYRCE